VGAGRKRQQPVVLEQAHRPARSLERQRARLGVTRERFRLGGVGVRILEQAGAAGVTLRVLLVDLAATPEDDHHGRFVDALKAAAPQLPLLLVVDESAYRRRFDQMPERIAERRAAWRQWAAARELQWRSGALDDLGALGAPAPPSQPMPAS